MSTTARSDLSIALPGRCYCAYRRLQGSTKRIWWPLASSPYGSALSVSTQLPELRFRRLPVIESAAQCSTGFGKLTGSHVADAKNSDAAETSRQTCAHSTN